MKKFIALLIGDWNQ